MTDNQTKTPLEEYLDDLPQQEQQGSVAIEDESLNSPPTQTLRPIDKKRLDALQKNTIEPLTTDDRWYAHTVLTQCFLPYRDPKTRDWERHNGDVSIFLTAGLIRIPQSVAAPPRSQIAGLPYGAKPRLFMSYITTQAVKNQSPVVPIQHSMTAMIKELGLPITGGKNGTIRNFKEQITRLAACNFRIAGVLPNGAVRHINSEPFKSFDVWFPADPDQKTLWNSEITLTTDFYENLKEHAIPYDVRAMRHIQNNARAQDIYLWMTQRLCRISHDKPLFMTWEMLLETFGGSMTDIYSFPRQFKTALLAARTAYPDARMSEDKDGFKFFHSAPPIPKTKLVVQKQLQQDN